MQDNRKLFRPVGRYVNIFLDMTTYEQLKQLAAEEGLTIAKKARYIIERFFESEDLEEE
ncbi:TPA: hypothetical protein OT849_002593 [Enterobacter cloacae]|nr:hypothetical protein [Enterobacter cloacae]